MVSLGLLNESCALTEETNKAVLNDLHGPSPEVVEKMVILFHDKCTFQENGDKPTLWAEEGATVKSKAVESWFPTFYCLFLFYY